MVMLIIISLIIILPDGAFAQERLRLATTTSTENSGLLSVLLPPFEKILNLKVDVVAVGTGKAIKLGENGDADVILVHARSMEDKFVNDGYGVNRRDVMHNDFVIVGPTADPAGVKHAKTASEAFSKIAAKQSMFVSRGDQSGTHKMELGLWGKAGIKPSGSWYLESGCGMGEVLVIANEKSAYTLTDRGTYLAFQMGKKIDLPVLCEGDLVLFNPYGIIAVNPERHPHVDYVKAMALIGWMTGQQGQKIIKEFGKDTFGEPLFSPDAIKNPVSQ